MKKLTWVRILLGIILILVIVPGIFLIRITPNKKVSLRDDGTAYFDFTPGNLEKILKIYSRPSSLSADIKKGTIVVDGYERTFSYYLPKKGKENPPVVFAYHGSYANDEVMRAYTAYEFEQLADTHGFMVVYPNGFGGGWHDLRIKSPHKANKLQIDDVNYIKELVKHLQGNFSIDAKNLFHFGFSNGGQMVFRLALEAPQYVRAFAAAGASLPIPEHAHIPYLNVPALPALLLHGTADKVVPYEGGNIKLLIFDFGDVMSAMDTAYFWSTAAGHSGEPAVSELPRQTESNWVELRTWDTAGSPEVNFFTIHGSGHGFPVEQYAVNGMNQDMSYPQESWAFFEKNLLQE